MNLFSIEIGAPHPRFDRETQSAHLLVEPCKWPKLHLLRQKNKGTIISSTHSVSPSASFRPVTNEVTFFARLIIFSYLFLSPSFSLPIVMIRGLSTLMKGGLGAYRLVGTPQIDLRSTLTCSTHKLVVMIWFLRFCKRKEKRIHVSPSINLLTVINTQEVFTVIRAAFMLLPIFSLFCFSPLCRCRSYPASSVPFRSDSERVKVLPGGEREERGERRERREGRTKKRHWRRRRLW